ncbi:MAG TPA: glycosyl hydrolase family 18 protein [Bacteroidota bacterium]|nr:glycosyl hydrolase family 18 protein [Bacteroidota bacterium]
MKSIGSIARQSLFCAFAALIICSDAATAQGKLIIGYYPSWKWNAPAPTMLPENIPYAKLSIINYAFFYPLADGSVAGRDTVGDAVILGGKRYDADGRGVQGPSLVSLAKAHGVRVVLSVGGWDDSNNFPAVAASREKRTRFAHSCIDQIRQYGFEGIDIDWEYPGFKDHNGTPADRQNATLLLRETRDSLDAYGNVIGRHLLLTAAVAASAANLAGFDMEAVAPLLDMVNVMTYDFCDTWDALSGHNAPLYAPTAADTSRNVDAAFRFLANSLGLSPKKISLGVPFYGHSFAGCAALYAPHAGTDTVHFPPGALSYSIIASKFGEFTRHWDEKARVPYLIGKKWNVLISYDDEASVREKAQYVIDHGAAGLIIWEITDDFMGDSQTPLLDTIARTFGGPGRVR